MTTTITTAKGPKFTPTILQRQPLGESDAQKLTDSTKMQTVEVAEIAMGTTDEVSQQTVCFSVIGSGAYFVVKCDLHSSNFACLQKMYFTRTSQLSGGDYLRWCYY